MSTILLFMHIKYDDIHFLNVILILKKSMHQNKNMYFMKIDKVDHQNWDANEERWREVVK